MRKPEDITGNRYGMLVAKERTDRKKGRCYMWRCQCDCGNMTEKPIDSLQKGSIKSCGCLLHQFTDVTGERYGKLKVISYVGNEKRKSKWKCQCDCGNVAEVSYSDLTSGNTKSCGCLGVEKLSSLYVEGTNVSKILNPKLRCTNTSGYTGVCFSKSKDMWETEIRFQGKRYRLGNFKNKEDAIRARKEAENRLHGEFLEWYENEYKKK